MASPRGAVFLRTGGTLPSVPLARLLGPMHVSETDVDQTGTAMR